MLYSLCFQKLFSVLVLKNKNRTSFNILFLKVKNKLNINVTIYNNINLFGINRISSILIYLTIFF